MRTPASFSSCFFLPDLMMCLLTEKLETLLGSPLSHGGAPTSRPAPGRASSPAHGGAPTSCPTPGRGRSSSPACGEH